MVQGWIEPLTHSGSLAGPATPTKPEPLPLQATPDKALRPAEELQPHPEAALLHGERSIYQDANVSRFLTPPPLPPPILEMRTTAASQGLDA